MNAPVANPDHDPYLDFLRSKVHFFFIAPLHNVFGKRHDGGIRQAIDKIQGNTVKRFSFIALRLFPLTPHGFQGDYAQCLIQVHAFRLIQHFFDLFKRTAKLHFIFSIQPCTAGHQ